MTRIQLRRGTAAQWASANPVLAAGEPGVETDTGYLKVGNGTTAWNSRPYQEGPAGPSAYDVAVADGFVGTETEWLASLESTVPGPQGNGLQIDGTAPTYAALPTTGLTADDMYLTVDTGKLYIWDGAAWPAELDGIQLQGPPGTTSWDGLTDKPSTFPPSTHTHTWTSVTDKPAVVAAGATKAGARTAIDAFDSALAPELVAVLPGTPVAGKLYALPE